MNRRNVINANTDESRYSVAPGRRSFPRALVPTDPHPELLCAASKDDGEESLTRIREPDEKQS